MMNKQSQRELQSNIKNGTRTRTATRFYFSPESRFLARCWLSRQGSTRLKSIFLLPAVGCCCIKLHRSVFLPGTHAPILCRRCIWPSFFFPFRERRRRWQRRSRRTRLVVSDWARHKSQLSRLKLPEWTKTMLPE